MKTTMLPTFWSVLDGSVVVVLISGSCCSPSFAAESVDQAQALTGQSVPKWGVVFDPDEDCTIRRDGEKLSVTVPGGKVHTLTNFESRKRAPRVLQKVIGDFDVQVKVSGDFDPGIEAGPGVRESGRNSFNGAGLLVWENEDNFLRVERNIWVTRAGDSYGYAPLVEHWRENQIVSGFGGKPDSSGNSECTYLRLCRRGDRFEVATSVDGIVWNGKRALTASFPTEVSLGVVAINSSKKPFMVTFSELKLSQP